MSAAALAAWQERDGCGCHRCRSARHASMLESGMSRADVFGVMPVVMVLCRTCGNKRCPKATNHALTCAGSNEPGQPGSIYA